MSFKDELQEIIKNTQTKENERLRKNVQWLINKINIYIDSTAITCAELDLNKNFDLIWDMLKSINRTYNDLHVYYDKNYKKFFYKIYMSINGPFTLRLKNAIDKAANQEVEIIKKTIKDSLREKVTETVRIYSSERPVIPDDWFDAIENKLKAEGIEMLIVQTLSFRGINALGDNEYRQQIIEFSGWIPRTSQTIVDLDKIRPIPPNVRYNYTK